MTMSPRSCGISLLLFALIFTFYPLFLWLIFLHFCSNTSDVAALSLLFCLCFVYTSLVVCFCVGFLPSKYVPPRPRDSADFPYPFSPNIICFLVFFLFGCVATTLYWPFVIFFASSSCPQPQLCSHIPICTHKCPWYTYMHIPNPLPYVCHVVTHFVMFYHVVYGALACVFGVFSCMFWDVSSYCMP